MKLSRESTEKLSKIGLDQTQLNQLSIDKDLAEAIESCKELSPEKLLNNSVKGEIGLLIGTAKHSTGPMPWDQEIGGKIYVVYINTSTKSECSFIMTSSYGQTASSASSIDSIKEWILDVYLLEEGYPVFEISWE